MKLVGGASGCHDKHNSKSFFIQLLTCHGWHEEEAMSSGLRYRTNNQKSGYYHITSDKNGGRLLLVGYAAWVGSVLHCLEPEAVINPPMPQRHVRFAFGLIELGRDQDTQEIFGC